MVAAARDDLENERKRVMHSTARESQQGERKNRKQMVGRWVAGWGVVYIGLVLMGGRENHVL